MVPYNLYVVLLMGYVLWVITHGWTGAEEDIDWCFWHYSHVLILFSMSLSIFTYQKYDLATDFILETPGCVSGKLSNMFGCNVSWYYNTIFTHIGNKLTD